MDDMMANACEIIERLARENERQCIEIERLHQELDGLRKQLEVLQRDAAE